MLVGITLKRARLQAGRTQSWLAEKVGVSDATVSRWESGRVDPPASKFAAAMAFLNPSSDAGVPS